VQLLGRIIGQPAFQVLRVLAWIQTPAARRGNNLFTAYQENVKYCSNIVHASLSHSHSYSYSFHGCHGNSDFATELCNWKPHTVCIKRKLKADQLCAAILNRMAS
jgi:hypothetical protein